MSMNELNATAQSLMSVRAMIEELQAEAEALTDKLKPVCACLTEQLRPLLKPYFGKPLCVCGVGNQAVPHDALGPETARKFQPKAYESFLQRSVFDKIAVICPGVSTLTSLPTETIIANVAADMGAACVLTIDSSVCKDVERLCCTIQLSSNGMQTYQGAVDLSQTTLRIPVLSITVPTAIRAADLSARGNVDPKLFFTPLHKTYTTAPRSLHPHMILS